MKRMDRDSIKQRQFSNDILDTIPEAILYTTLKGKIIFINRALENLFEIPGKELIGKRIPEILFSLLDPSDHEHLIDKFRKLISGIKVSPFQVKYKNKILEVSPNISLRTRRITATIRNVTESISEALDKNEFRLKKADFSNRIKVEQQLIEKNEDLS